MISEKHNIAHIDEFIHVHMKLSVTIRLIADDYIFFSNVIGLKDKKYLIIDMPAKAVEDLLTCQLNHAEIIIRGISNTELAHVIAIKSYITSVTSNPYWLIHVKLPNWFETAILRESKRFKVDIPVVVNNGDVHYDAVVKDISRSGCGLYLYGVKQANLKNNVDITITSDSHTAINAPLTCRVINIRHHGDETFVGTVFSGATQSIESLRNELFDYWTAQTFPNIGEPHF